MSEQCQHTISTAWVTTFRRKFHGEETYTHVCPLCKYFYRDEKPEGLDVCPSCKAEMIKKI